jgi:hypothetical protein
MLQNSLKGNGNATVCRSITPAFITSDMPHAQSCLHANNSFPHAIISNGMHAGAPKAAKMHCDEAATERELLQGTQGLSLHEDAGITPTRMPQPTLANTPVCVMGMALSGPSNM